MHQVALTVQQQVSQLLVLQVDGLLGLAARFLQAVGLLVVEAIAGDVEGGAKIVGYLAVGIEEGLNVGFDIFVYAAGGTSKNGNLWTATNYINDKDVYGTFVDLGLKAEFYKQKLNGIRLGTSFGYKYQVYAYDKSLSGNSGVYSHWLTADLDFCLSYFNAGFKSDIFLSSKIKNNDHFSYEGLYSDCFNHISFCYYVGLNVRFTRLKLEARIGSYLVPQFSPEKISYHNMTKTHVDGSYFEIRVYYRIFTTGKVHSSPYMFD